MDDQRSRNSRQFLAQLAREYSEKFAELEEMVRNSQSEQLLHHLGALGELTTDRFRAAQLALFDSLANLEGNGFEDTIETVLGICRSFDELHILFQFLLERSANSEPTN